MRPSVDSSGALCQNVLQAEAQAAVHKLQYLTIGWMCVEFSVALVAGIDAHSVSLTAFGADSLIELLSAVVVLRRIQVGPSTERAAARINAILLYALALYIVCTSGFFLWNGRFDARPSAAGMVLLVAAAIIMPSLGSMKKRKAIETRNASLRADAAQSNLCAYMSWIALAGLAINGVFHLPWADCAAALCLLPIVIREANEARKGEVCH
ncbi:MAG: cation transporter [Acidobacteriales bacterium]|nr:cation transporter [Terriglobales bacterium]